MKDFRKNILIIVFVLIIGVLSTACESDQLIEEENTYLLKLNEITKKIIEKDGVAVQSILNSAYDSYGDLVENIYFANASGKMILSPSLQLPEDYDARGRNWYKKALENELYMPKPYKNVVIEKKIQSVSKAIYKDDVLIGVIGMEYELKGAYD